MPFKDIIREFQDMKGGIGSISRRSFEIKFPYLHWVRSYNAVPDESTYMVETSQSQPQCCWACLPHELLRDILQRIEESENSWPSRRNIVACSAVCSTWRAITKEVVKTPEQSGRLTFPLSLKQPGPRDTFVQCFIKRNRAMSAYFLYLGLTPNLAENGKFLLVARKVRRATNTDYVISLDADDMARSDAYVGKLRSNFLGTKFAIYDCQPPHCIVDPLDQPERRGLKQVHPQGPTRSYTAAHIVYELNVLGARGPRRMQCTLCSIPALAVEEGGSAPTPTDILSPLDTSLSSGPLSRYKTAIVDCSFVDSEPVSFENGKDVPLVLKNKAPRWHEQLQCWCLNFRGRVTVASVKNFQLVAAVEPSQQGSQNDHEKVLLQFGKIGKDTYTMDYRYPLSAFQAFAICLSSFDTKLACE